VTAGGRAGCWVQIGIDMDRQMIIRFRGRPVDSLCLFPFLMKRH
jgi:hypothetical protein